MECFNTILNCSLERMIEFVFKVYDINADQKISDEEVRYILNHCNFSSLLSSTEEEKIGTESPNSPKEGLFTRGIETYTTYLHRFTARQEISELVDKVMPKRKTLNLREFTHQNKEVCSDMFCAVMAYIHSSLPLTGAVSKMRQQFYTVMKKKNSSMKS